MPVAGGTKLLVFLGKMQEGQYQPGESEQAPPDTEMEEKPPSAPAAALLTASGYEAVLKEHKIPPSSCPLQVWQ